MWIDAEDSLEIKKQREYLLLMWKVEIVILKPVFHKENFAILSNFPSLYSAKSK